MPNKTRAKLAVGLAGRSKFPLAHLPTPLEPLTTLSEYLRGPNIFIKRDDCTGLALGGNKTRKLEYLVADALQQDATVLVSEGGLQSNHARQTAAAAVKANLKCALVLDNKVNWPQATYQESGNALLDRLLGAEIHLCESGESRRSKIDNVLEELKQDGQKPYFIPTGGSNAVGGLGYAQCALELDEQAKAQNLDMHYVILASGSGGTQGGFLAGLALLESKTQCIGIDIDKDTDNVKNAIQTVHQATADLLTVATEKSKNYPLILEAGYATPGYGQPNDGMREAVELLAQLEAIILDPVYSGKAMAGLIDMVRTGRFEKNDTVVFLHTGGSPALFTYSEVFATR